MPKRTFTPTWIKNLKPADSRQDFTEAGRPGFMLRVWPGGQKTFVFRYWRNEKASVMTLGQWPAMSLEEAHDEHVAARKQFVNGLDPIEEKERAARAREAQEQRRRTVEGVTIRNVIAEWGWHWARRRRKRPREAIRLLKVHLAKPLAGKPAQDITKRDLVKAIDKVMARGSMVMANRLRDLFAQVFEFAASRDLIPSSPAAGLLRKPGGDEESRERSLSNDEVKTFWSAMEWPKTAISAQVRLGLKLILITAQRPGEVATARFDQFDVDERLWTIPADIAKNEREHYVPLTDLAVELIEQLRTLAKGRPHLLPSQQSKLKPNEPISERALSRALKNNHVGEANPKLFGCEPFTPHDLRRTAATHITSLGIPRLHVSKVLNHLTVPKVSNHADAASDTTAIYDRHHYWDEKKRALEVWETELRAIIAGKKPKVVAIGKGRRAHS
jgi:integrase